ncbi:hypothetical protein [Nonomuraea rhizosphaerae]|uniref:hypothetical protein n=1 Tax=Nonomuraea rhizosphaerae TaxID=2665663 RepID=UPI001C5E8646|nr:hypothetical protein [Nonomuraea rhizosphaerae]
MTGTHGKRVVVVDDDDISRTGIVALLSGTPGVEVVAGLGHEAALTRPWDDVDVVLVDAADERRPDDHFPGVAVVESVRRTRSRRQTTVIVLTGHFLDGAVRRRMREARADYFYHRSQLGDAGRLRAAVLRPEGGVPGPADPEEEIRHGVSAASHVNAAVAHALAEDLPRRLRERARPRSRAWGRVRERFNRRAGLAVMTSDGRAPDREQSLPSLPQIARFLAWATRVKTPPVPPFPPADE